MRLFVAALVALVAFAAAPVRAADKDEDKAKEAALAFFKALKAKDIDALMKTVDVPFLFEGKNTITTTEDLKAELKTFFEGVKAERIPSEVGQVLDMAAIRKRTEEDKTIYERLEKVLGSDGYMVAIKVGKKEGGIFVRIKDGQAKVAVIPK